jgi:hypothetical protein
MKERERKEGRKKERKDGRKKQRWSKHITVPRKIGYRYKFGICKVTLRYKREST